MSLFRVTHDSIPPEVQRCALTIGNFDGVHLGHQAIIEETRRHAEVLNVRSVAITFDPPPALLLRSDYRPVVLSTFEQRAELLHAYGVDHVIILKTNRDLLNLEANDFFHKILIDQFQTQAIVEGTNFQFGRNRSGTQELLRAWCKAANVKLSIITDQYLNGSPISSSAIRTALVQGDVVAAAQMLGRRYSVSGIVEHGAARGRTIGFPTANIGAIEVLIPGHGVYAGSCQVEGKRFATAIHVGPNVSFDEHETKVECYLLDFQGDLYGRRLEIDFHQKLRSTMKFSSIDELVSQMNLDVAKTAGIVFPRS